MCIYCLQIPPIIGPIQPFTNGENMSTESCNCHCNYEDTGANII